MTDEHMIAAAEAKAALYDGDDRQDIKTDVMNAFYAGVKFALQSSPNAASKPQDEPARNFCPACGKRNTGGIHTCSPQYAVEMSEPAQAQEPVDPLDWPLPCDITVGCGTIKKGLPLRLLVTRMEVLSSMAKDSFAMAAGQCVHPKGVIGDEHGNPMCPIASSAPDYEELEREHLGDPQMRTGIYHPDNMKGALPTHRCNVCSALWRFIPNRDTGWGDSWNLRSKTCGPCCDCVEMGEQIEPLTWEMLAASIPSPAPLQPKEHAEKLRSEGWSAALNFVAASNWNAAIEACAKELESQEDLDPKSKFVCNSCATAVRALKKPTNDKAAPQAAAPMEREALKGLLEIEEARIASGAFKPNAEAQRRIDAARAALDSPVAVSDEDIEKMLTELHNIAMDYDSEEYGLPMHHEGYVQKMIAAARALSRTAPGVAEGWQPIETAPKDGTVVLGWDPTWYDIATPIRWNEKRQRWDFFHVSHQTFASHWRPMLAAPSADKEGS
jgi:hypothetical protein